MGILGTSFMSRTRGQCFIDFQLHASRRLPAADHNRGRVKATFYPQKKHAGKGSNNDCRAATNSKKLDKKPATGHRQAPKIRKKTRKNGQIVVGPETLIEEAPYFADPRGEKRASIEAGREGLSQATASRGRSDKGGPKCIDDNS